MAKPCKESHVQGMGQGSCMFGAPRTCSSPILERECGFEYGFRREKTCSDTFGSVLTYFLVPKRVKVLIVFVFIYFSFVFLISRERLC